MVFLKSYYFYAHVAVTLKKHLRNLKIITNVNVTCVNHQKRHAKHIVIVLNEVPISPREKWALRLYNIQLC